jgi:hypothetical protein
VKSPHYHQLMQHAFVHTMIDDHTESPTPR